MCFRLVLLLVWGCLETKYGFPKFFRLRKLIEPFNCVGVSPTRVPFNLRVVGWCFSVRKMSSFNLNQGKLPYFPYRTHYPDFRTGFLVRKKGN